jgi:hypothetical protein
MITFCVAQRRVLMVPYSVADDPRYGLNVEVIGATRKMPRSWSCSGRQLSGVLETETQYA